jgi:hypothetical protein
MTDHKKAALTGAIAGKELFDRFCADGENCTHCFVSGAVVELLAQMLAASDAVEEELLDQLADIIALALARRDGVIKGAGHDSPPKLTDQRKLN